MLRSRVDMTCAELRTFTLLLWNDGMRGLSTDDMATLGMVMRTNGLPLLREMRLNDNSFGDPGTVALFKCMDGGSAPSLTMLDLGGIRFGTEGAKTLAAALEKGAMPMLREMILSANPMGREGVAALTAPLRKLPLLANLYLDDCDVGDEGVASLVDKLGKDDFKALVCLGLAENRLTEVSCERLASAIDEDKMPALEQVTICEHHKVVFAQSFEMQLHGAWVTQAIERAMERRAGVPLAWSWPHPHP